MNIYKAENDDTNVTILHYDFMNIYKAQNDDTNVTIRQQGHFSLFVCIGS